MQTIYDAKILIVDDNQDLLNLVTTALRSTGYNQLTACTGCAAAQAAFAANRPDLMILDINLPDGDGFTLFRTLHSMADIPALFLSARDADADRLFGLGLGADDYLTKPIKMKLLVSRVQALLKRVDSGTPTAGAEPHSGITIDRERYTATCDGREIVLPRKEFALLDLLCSQPGRLVTREEIYSRIWGSDVVVGDRTIDVHIRKLRQKIGDRRIVTVKGVGYKYEP